MKEENNYDITEKIIKELFIDIDLSKKFTFDFKSSFLNNNFNNSIGVIAIKRNILLKFFDSFEQTIKNIEKKIIMLQKELKDNEKSIKTQIKYKTKSLDIINYENKEDEPVNKNDNSFNDLDKNRHLINRIKKRNKITRVNHNDYFKKNYSISTGSYKNEFFQNQINYINNMNNYNYKINNNNMSLKSNNDNIKHYINYENYTLKNPEIISKKFYNFKVNNNFNTFDNIDPINKYENNKIISNISYQKGYNSVLKADKNFNNYKDNCQFLNEKEKNNEESYNSSLPKNINTNKFSIYLNKKNSDENQNYFNIEETSTLNNEPEIKIKSPIREIIKKIIKNKNKINESFLNYSNMSGNKHNKSFNFNKKEQDSIIAKIKNSENLILFFSEKYGNGDFNVFLNEYKKNKINKELIKREINTIEKVIKKNGNNIGNSLNGLNDKKTLENPNRIVNKRKITPYKKDKKKLNLKNKTIEQIKKNQKIYRTLTSTSREINKSINQRNDSKILKKNKISISFGRKNLKEKNENNFDASLQNYAFENKNRSYYSNNNHKRNKTPFGNYNNINNILF